MHKRSLILIIAVFLCYPLSAQNLFPTAADNYEWDLAYSSWGGPCQIAVFKTGDIVDVCGQTYAEIYSCNEFGNDCNVRGYYREADSIVYIRSAWRDCTTPEGVIYDFRRARPDSILCMINHEFETQFWTISEESIEYDGRTFHSWKMNYDYWEDLDFPMTWVEGIGALEHPFYSLGCFHPACEIQQALYQVRKDGEIIFENEDRMGFLRLCEGNWNVLRDDNALRFYPTLLDNPYLTVENSRYETVQVDVLNLAGQVVASRTYALGKRAMDLQHLTPGIYFIRATAGEEVMIQKLLKS